MEWLDDLASALPAPRDDEPPDLRRKIIAELRDHLHAALQRELLLTGDATQARHNVLVKFGDPARLARKLWFDALWEKIMTQRWMLAALAVMVLVSIGSMGLTWFLVVQAGQVNQALLEQNRATNEIMLTKLAALGKAPGNTEKSMEWNSLKVQLSLGKPGGVPAAEFELTLQGHLLDAGSVASLTRKTGVDGVADFGLVRPGQHLLQVESPWGELLDQAEPYGQLITVLPGEPQTAEIICPAKPDETEIAISVDWPNDLADRPLWLVCDLIRSPRKVGGSRWTRRNDNEPQYVAVDASGELVCLDAPRSGDGLDQSRHANFQFFRDGETFYSDNDLIMRSYVDYSKSDADSPGIYRYRNDSDPEPFRPLVPPNEQAALPHIWFPRTAPVSRLTWPAGAYSVTHIAVGLEPKTEEEELPDDMLHPVFLGGIALDGSTGAVRLRLLYPNEKQASIRRRKRREGKIEIPRFEAVAGRLNEWRITLPQPLAELLQEPPVQPIDADFEPHSFRDSLKVRSKSHRVQPIDADGSVAYPPTIDYSSRPGPARRVPRRAGDDRPIDDDN